MHSSHFGGIWTYEIWSEDGKDLVFRDRCENGNCTAGLNDILQTNFASGTQKASWFVGLIDNSGFTALAAADTSATHAGWTEQTTGYTESVRQAWTPGAISGASITNPSPATFTVTGTPSFYGAFLISNSTKGGITGIMWSTGAFGSVQSPTAGQSFKVSYTIPAS